MNFKKIHQEILEKSSKYSIIKNEIKKNGIIKIQKSKLDLFTFTVKTIISQQHIWNLASWLPTPGHGPWGSISDKWDFQFINGISMFF